MEHHKSRNICLFSMIFISQLFPYLVLNCTVAYSQVKLVWIWSQPILFISLRENVPPTWSNVKVMFDEGEKHNANSPLMKEQGMIFSGRPSISKRSMNGGSKNHNCYSAGHHKDRYVLKSAKCGNLKKITWESQIFMAWRVPTGYLLQPSHFTVEETRAREVEKCAYGDRTIKTTGEQKLDWTPNSELFYFMSSENWCSYCSYTLDDYQIHIPNPYYFSRFSVYIFKYF